MLKLDVDELVARVAERAECLAHTVQRHCSEVGTTINATVQHATIQPKALLYIGLLFITFTWLAVTITHHIRTRNTQPSTRPSTPNLEKRSFKAPEREPGGTQAILLSR